MCECYLLFSICTRLLTPSHIKQMDQHNGPTHIYTNSSSLIPKTSPAQELETALLIHTLTHIQIHILASTHMDTYSNARHAALINTHLHILIHHIYTFAYTPTHAHAHTPTHTDGTTHQCTTRSVSSTPISRNI